MAKQILGKVVPIVKGTYNSSTQYAILDIVEYNGSSYIAKTNVQGQAPTNTTYWQLLAKQGDKPVYKVDYLTDAEMAEIVNDIITDSTNAFNQNASAKTTAFNNNATDKTTAFNNNATSKTGDFNDNASSKTTTFNSNASDKQGDFNSNASSLKDDFNRNATAKTEAYDDNASSKLSTYNSNHTDKLSAYNSNASDKTTAYNNNHTDKLGAYNSNDTAKTTAYNNNATAKTTAFNENYEDKIDLFDEHSEELQAELDRYKTLENALPHVNGTGESITLNDTANSPLSLELESNTSQYTTTGAQLIDFSTLHDSNTTNSFTNDVLTVSTSSGTYANAFLDITTLYKSNAGQTLRFDFDSIKYDVAPSSRIVGLAITSQGTTSRVTLIGVDKSVTLHEIPADTSNISAVSLSIYANNTNTPVTNTLTIVKPMLHFGEDKIQYEKYTGIAPSPSPDYPQDIHTISGNNTIKVENKNLINPLMQNASSNDVTCVNNGDGSFTLNGTASSTTTFRCDQTNAISGNNNLHTYNGTYTMSCQHLPVGVRVSILKHEVWQTICSVDSTNSVKTENVQNWESCSIAITVSSGTVLNNVTIKPMLEKSSTATTYVPHQEQTAQLNLGDVEYCKFGDYKDRFFKNIPGDADYDATRELGKWYLKKNIGKVVLDGSESYQYSQPSTSDPYGYYYKVGDASSMNAKGSTQNVKSNYFRYAPRTNDNVMFTGNSAFLQFVMSSITSVENFKTWLSTHNTTVYYELATPTYTLLNNTLQSQLETINNKLLSYQEQTNISQENNDLAFNIKAKAVYDLNKLVERVATLENE